MKKLLALVLAVLMVVTIFAGCAAKEESSSSQSSSTPAGDSSSTGGDSKEGPYKFGYTPATMNNPFFTYIEGVMRKIVEDKGDEMVTTDPQFDVSKQISQIEDMVTQGIDVLMLNPVDSEGVRPGLDAAKKANVIIVNFDNDVADKDMVDCILVSNNENAGYVVGQKVVKDFPDGAKIAILHQPTAQACIDRVAGFRRAISEAANKDAYKEVAEQNGGGSTQDSLAPAENILQGNPDLDLFFCINDPSAVGAVAALKAANKVGDIKVYGIDGAPEGKAAIKAGEMVATGAQSPKAIAEDSIEVAYKLLAGETVEHKILVDTFLIDGSNVDQYGTDSWQ
ncbi:sugar ABC transporter substrate-binding protein [Zongyangia hominis]|uniref:Sugar ABC transporter substrate-binding protein n=1 Tax=Zongyangia hominis TaxID=2763677 RepID=A0A926I6V6_9FIRM|nr:sugar ABC transporter substrate-binding protein [Zongyangia hominis]MBC8570449.1 sugar ABC transporter substrate-binding protein [Zongyangia hominis]